jgi:sortase A
MTALDERPVEPPRTVLRAEMVDDTGPVSASPTEVAWPRTLGRVLVAVALVMAWAVTYVMVLSGLSAARAQKGLYAQLRTELAQGIAPIASPVATGAPIALLDISSADLHKLVVVEGTAAEQLQNGPGHLRSSALPGQSGISVVMGRSLSYGGVFSRIDALRPGDTITVTTGQGRFSYRVTDEPRSGGVLRVPDTTKAMLTLVTSKGSGWLSGLESSSAIYVDAIMTGTPQRPTSTPAAATSSELPMHGQHSFSTWASLVLALQLLAVVLAVMAWARANWSGTLAHVLGLPALLGALWLTSDFAARLLPNLM